MYYVIETGGKQYVVKTGSTLKVERLDAEVGKEVTFDQVLLTANDDGADVKIGLPYLAGITVSAVVEEQDRHDKIRVVKYKRKVRYTKVHGHKQYYTKVKIK
jgi:large subunit ribosomal protein L21